MLKKLITLSIAFSLTTLLPGCGGNATKDFRCTGNDWTALGHATAIEGKSVRSFDKYKEQCANLEEHALSDFLDGYTKGIIAYCTYDNGYALGSKNQDKTNVCPTELRSHFNRGYAHGKNDLKVQLDRLRSGSEDMEKKETTIPSAIPADQR